MSSEIKNKQHFKANNTTNLPILNQLFNNTEHHRQTYQTPLNINTIKEHKKVKTLRTSPFNNLMKPEILSKNGTNSYETFKTKQMRTNHQNLNNELLKRQEDLLLQVYTKLAQTNERKRMSTNAEINSEYEELQRKYCPKFKLINNFNNNYNNKQNFGQIKRHVSNIRKSERILKNRGNCSNNTKTREKSNWNLKQSLKTPAKETLVKIENLSGNQKTSPIPDDSEKTITPGELTDNESCQEKNLAKEKPNFKPGLSNSPKSLLKGQTSYPQLQQIFYHQSNPNPSTTYNLKNEQDQLKLEIRQAITLGKSSDATINQLLANTIEKALQEKFTWSTIQATINNIKNYNSKQKILHLLQILLRQRVFILCTVRTCNFSNLLSILDRIMYPVKAQFAPVLQHFQHCCVIEAIVPQNYLKFNSKQMRYHLDRDAEALKVKRIDVVDESRGEVSVQCLPVSMPNTSKSMETKGYNVLNSDYGFRANKEIILDTKTAGDYRKLIKNLLQIPDIETISDNVIY